MTRLTAVLKTILPFFLITPCLLLNGQTNLDFEPHEFLIHFEDDVEEAYIDSIRLAYNSSEVWVTPLSDVRLWRVDFFPFTPPGSTVPITDINGVVPPVKTKTGVDGVDFNLKMPVDPVSGSTIGANLQNFACSPEYSIFIPSSDNKVKVSIFDTGYSPQFLQEDYVLPSSISSGYDYVDMDEDFSDLHGHGTHITGIISHVSQSISGVNEKISFDIRRTHDENGQGNLSSVVQALDDAILDQTNIVNMSFSHAGANGVNSKIFKHAISIAEQFNILIIASAGNNSVNNDDLAIASYPASFQNENIISVASVNCNMELSTFSNFGVSSVDIAAPGEFIHGPSLNSSLSMMSGTSQATAVTSGLAVALATHLQIFSNYGIKCNIEQNARSSSGLLKLFKSGGIIDAEESLDNLANTDCISAEKRSNFITESLESAMLHPNPFYNNFNITTEKNIKSVKIYSLTGNLLLSKEVRGNDISLSNLGDLRSGAYFIKVETDEDTQTVKAIKL